MTDLETVEQVDKYADLRNGLRRLAAGLGEWAGLPMPLEDMPLRIEPTYPKAAELMAISNKAEPAPDGVTLRNTFWSKRHRCEIYIYEENGKVDWCIGRGANNVDRTLSTMFASVAWGIEQEHLAIQLLGSLVRHHTFKTYLLTGMFLETSRRSGLTYIFRRLKPTIALAPSAIGLRKMHVLCALCLHPIAYYGDSWAGAMCPTDDVIAHLMLMRGDEHMFWRRANQHPPYRPEAAI